MRKYLVILLFLFVFPTFCWSAAEHVYKNDANLVSLYLVENNGNDSVGSNNLSDCSHSGSVAYTQTDPKEGSYEIDLEDSGDECQHLCITDGSQSGLDITGDISIGGWIKKESDGAALVHELIAKYTGGGNYSYRLEIANDTPYFSLSDNGSTEAHHSGGTVPTLATWYHVVGVYNGTDIRLYVDGTYTGSATSFSAGIYDSAADFQIGADNVNETCTDGLLDELFVFNDELSADEVEGIHTWGIEDAPAGGGQVIIICELKGLERAIKFGIVEKFLCEISLDSP